MAVEDEVIPSNPALGLLRNRRTKAAKRRERARVGETVKAMTREQRNAFSAPPPETAPMPTPPSYSGPWPGCAAARSYGLKWAAVDLEARRLHVHEQLLDDSTKSGIARDVDAAAPLADALRDLQAARRQEAFRLGASMSPYVVFPDLPEKPTSQDEQKAAKRLLRAMVTCLKRADLPGHFTLHSLRHTFCSLLIAEGVSPVYVQQQAGHSSVNMTVGTYGSWFPAQASGAMDRLAAGVPGSRVVTNPAEVATSADPLPAQALPPTGTYASGAISRPSPG